MIGSWFVPSSSAEETGRYSPSDAAHRNILRPCDELAIHFSYLLLNILCDLGEAYLKFLFPQSQRTAPPCQLKLAPSCQTEFIICDQTIEICFRDLKSLLNIHKIMNKSQTLLNKMIAVVMLAYSISIVIGEAIRDVQYAGISPQDFNLLTVPEVDKRSRWHLFSGPFLLIKQRYKLPDATLSQIIHVALMIFANLIFDLNVRTLVRT